MFLLVNETKRFSDQWPPRSWFHWTIQILRCSAKCIFYGEYGIILFPWSPPRQTSVATNPISSLLNQANNRIVGKYKYTF